ncbi:MAG: dihydropteroate synthase [Chloroflexi bacterium]|nr:dihydropteroate synthase [Chloroflexota bacterium]
MNDFKATQKGITRIGNRDFVWGSRTFVMGVINLTPDSFSGDGIGGNVEVAVRMAVRFQEEGADLIDVGGESTRPPAMYGGSRPISDEEELARVVPVIEALKQEIDVPISVDTYKAGVAAEAVNAGASIINDVWGFRRDPDMAGVAARSGVPVVLMHNQDHTRYDDLVPDIISELRKMTDNAVSAGVKPENIILDPGMGFGKTAEHNLEILRRLEELGVLGRPLLIGMSRKSTIGHVLGLPVEERVEGTAATVALSIAGGADIVRVHDVKEMVRVARMSDAIVRGWEQH